MEKLTARLGLDTSEYDAKLGQAEKGMNNFGNSIQWIAAKSSAIAGITSAFVAVKKGIDATDGSADKFEATVGLLEGAWQGFWRTVWSGDWGRLIQNIDNTARATKELKEAQESLGMISASNTIKKARLQGDLSSALLGAAETADPAKRKDFFNQAIEAQKSLTQIEVGEVAYKLKVNEDFYKKLMGYDKKYSDYMIEQIRNIAGNWEYFFGPNSVALEGIKANIEHLKFMRDAQFRPEDIAKYDKQIKQQELIFNVLEDMKTLEAGLAPDQFRDYISLIGEYFAAIAKGEQDLVMLNRRLTQAQTKLDNTATRGITSVNPAYADIKHFYPDQGLMPFGGRPGVDITIDETTKALQQQEYAVNLLSDAFTSLFDDTGNGFENMIETMIKGIERLVAEMLAKKLVTLIMDYFGGSGSLFDTLFNVGSSALGSTSSGVPSGGSMDYLNLETGLKGKDIAISLRRVS